MDTLLILHVNDVLFSIYIQLKDNEMFCTEQLTISMSMWGGKNSVHFSDFISAIIKPDSGKM